MREGRQVAGRLAALRAPLPLAADRGGETEFEQSVERLVRVLQHGPQQPVHRVGAHRLQRQPACEVHVPERVDRVRDAVHPGVALQQPPVEGLVVLVRTADHEGVHGQRVVADPQGAGGAQPAHPRQGRDQRERVGGGRLPGHLGGVQGGAQEGQCLVLGTDSHGADVTRRYRWRAAGRGPGDRAGLPGCPRSDPGRWGRRSGRGAGRAPLRADGRSRPMDAPVRPGAAGES